MNERGLICGQVVLAISGLGHLHPAINLPEILATIRRRLDDAETQTTNYTHGLSGSTGNGTSEISRLHEKFLS